ncbi:MAG TPA: phosphotransferase family protein [Solirubrobacteraceae bacterium]|nr:phosphotransferase family protein [Solirubrobacteraceae bacterium]
MTRETALAELPARVRDAARRRWPDAQVGALQPLPGGISSLTFATSLTGAGPDDRRVVVKVAPPGLEPVRNRDVLRQARVIAAVHGAPGVLVPEVLVSDDGSPPFFVMAFIPGQAYEPKWDVSDAPPTPAAVRARARAAARLLARLQAIVPADVGITDAPLSLAEEVERWAALFGTAGDDLRAHESDLRDALNARLPPAAGPGGNRILHGDYRLGNIQFDGEAPAAIIDWEIWSVGDPRTDLAWLMDFTDPVLQRVAERDAANQAAADAMPSGRELLAEYMDEAGLATDPSDLDWFQAFAYYKLGAAMSVLCKRNRRQAEPDPGLELVAQTLPPMLDRGLELLGG